MQAPTPEPGRASGLSEGEVLLLLQSLAIFWAMCPCLVWLHECAHAMAAYTALLLTRRSWANLWLLIRGSPKEQHTTTVVNSNLFSLKALACLPVYLLTGLPGITPPQVNIHVLDAPPPSGPTTVSGPEIDSLIRHAGWIFSTLLAVLLSKTFPSNLLEPSPLDPVNGFFFHKALQLGTLSAAWLVALSAVSSDLLLHAPHRSSSAIRGTESQAHVQGGVFLNATFFCGNLGLLIAGVAESAVDYAKVLRTQVAICMQRGAQSGGIVAMVGGKASMGGNRPLVHGVASRSAPGKRDNLSDVLSKKLNRALGQKSLIRGQKPGKGGAAHGIFCGHTRFATSSVATEVESHPHQWTPETTEGIWRVETVGSEQLLVRQDETFGLWITHNGDFDFCNLLGQYRTHHDVEHFLTHVLDRPPAAACDSAMVAGMMEYLRTQGRLYASLRLAFYDTSDCQWLEVVIPRGARHKKDVESGMNAIRQAPSPAALMELAALLESELLKWLSEVRGSNSNGAQTPTDRQGEMLNNGVPMYVHHGAEGNLMQKLLAGGKTMEDGLIPKLVAVAQEYLAQRSKQNQHGSTWVGMLSDCRVLVEATLENFLHADIYRATCRFMKSAKGSFGLAVTCTLDTDKVALAAWGQPMTLGFNFEHKTILYSSESQNVMIPILKEDKDPLEVLVNFAAINQSYWSEMDRPAPLKNNGWRSGLCTMRVDMDEGGGEVMLLQLHKMSETEESKVVEGWPMMDAGGIPVSLDQLQGYQTDCAGNPSFCTVRMYQLKAAYEVPSLEDFVKQERIVDLVGNKYIKFQSKDAMAALVSPGKSDLVAADLSDTPRVLNVLRESWNTITSPNRQTAGSFFANLDAIYQATAATTYRPDPLEVHLLLIGVEMGLWLVEQAANDLRLVFPFLKVQVLSANKIISVLGNSRGKIPVPGSAFCRLTSRIGPNTMCLSVSQSGQTFPTIHATRILNALMPGRVYVMTGQVDTKMALAIGQRFTAGSPFTCRIFDTHAGWRSAEPPTVVCIAMHQCLTELITYCATTMADKYFWTTKKGPEWPSLTNCAGPSHGFQGRPLIKDPTSQAPAGWPKGIGPLGMGLTPDQLLDMRIVRDSFIDTGAPSLVGIGLDGQSFPSTYYRDLKDVGKLWAKHVTETPIAWGLSLVHITLTVFFGYPVLYSIGLGICAAAQCGDKAYDTVTYTLLILDGPLYLILPWVYATLLRLLQGRNLMHRFGKRTVVIADVPFVHQITETFVSKLWALSYGMTGLDVHGGSPQDHFVHRFTHRVVRGLLIAVGRPDGRMYSQTKTEAATILSILQAKVIQHMGGTSEVVAVGSNPFHPKTAVDFNLLLPDFRPRSLIEVLELGKDEDILNEAVPMTEDAPHRFRSSKRVIEGTSMKKAVSRMGTDASKLTDSAKKQAFITNSLRGTKAEESDLESVRTSRRNSANSDSGYAPPTFNCKAVNPNQLWAERRALVNGPNKGVPTDRSSLNNTVSQKLLRMSFNNGLEGMSPRSPGINNNNNNNNNNSNNSSGRPLVGLMMDNPAALLSGYPKQLLGDNVSGIPLFGNLPASNRPNGEGPSVEDSKLGFSTGVIISPRSMLQPKAMPAHLLPMETVSRTCSPMSNMSDVSLPVCPSNGLETGDGNEISIRDLLNSKQEDLTSKLQGGGPQLAASPARKKPFRSMSSSYMVGQHLLREVESESDADSRVRSETLTKMAESLKGIVSDQAVEEGLQALRSNIEECLVSQAIVEQLTENRYMALQRMMAFMTMFHAMARSVASLWPLVFDISRSQSGLRIATTAAPATASDLERTMVEIYGSDLLEAEKLRRMRVKSMNVD